MTVTQISQVLTQPRGGYLPLEAFEQQDYQDCNTLREQESVHPALMGLAVDDMTRFLYQNGDAFSISLQGAAVRDALKLDNFSNIRQAKSYLKSVTGIDDKSLDAALRLVGYDCNARGNLQAYRPVEQMLITVDTLYNLRTMILRSLDILDSFGGVWNSFLKFPGKYDEIICGDGDYLTENTLWDMKVSHTPPDKCDILQLLLYYILSQQSILPEYQMVTHIGFLNPRLNRTYRLAVNQIPQDVLKKVWRESLKLAR